MLPAMIAKPSVAIIGPGRLGRALALELYRSGYRISEVLGRDTRRSQAEAQALARTAHARAASARTARLDARIVWICVPDREIAGVAREIAPLCQWRSKTVFHSSGALSSNELAVLRRQGAAVASVHPMMTFVSDSAPVLQGVPFGLEGDARALDAARRIVKDLAGVPFSVHTRAKALYHVWGMFGSPLLLAALVTAEQVAHAAGITRSQARRNILPLVHQTLTNYAALGPARSFSGPMIRGDGGVVRRHLGALRRLAAVREVYLALARSALRHLPARNRKELQDVLGR
jgi:predicted short-subunit dehydrogenase-like oxidoreductase (DUF2520 family)